MRVKVYPVTAHEIALIQSCRQNAGRCSALASLMAGMAVFIFFLLCVFRPPEPVVFQLVCLLIVTIGLSVVMWRFSVKELRAIKSCIDLIKQETAFQEDSSGQDS